MKRLLITGASRGIGRAIAQKLAGPDYCLLLNGRDPATLAETCQRVREQQGQAISLPFDLTQVEQIEQLVATVGNDPLELLVHNAGVACVKPLADITLAEWEQTLALNITAPFLLTQKLVPLMPKGASIIHILSIAARTGFPGWSSYCMSKFALEGFSQSIREELRSRGIRVINLYPSATNTELWSHIAGEWPREKMMTPDEVAEAVHFVFHRPTVIAVDQLFLGNMAGTL